MLGVLSIGTVLPCVLTWIHRSGNLHFALNFLADHPKLKPNHIDETWLIEDLISILFMGVCSSGLVGMALGLWLRSELRRRAKANAWNERKIILAGAGSGIFVAFLDFPAYSCYACFHEESLAALLVVVLFAVTGATCGLWVGWQVYRSFHPELGIVPRFSLRTLILLALAWGVLLWLFKPLQ
jgi:magnesium-transporting ATPase (P-type)